MRTKGRKLTSILLAVIMAFSIFTIVPITASAAETDNKSIGDTFWYVFIGNGNVEITDYSGTATELTIPSTVDRHPVKSIGRGVFKNCTHLTSVTIPNGVTSIGEYAFSGCTSLASVTIPDSVIKIGMNAFENCRNLTSVTIPNGVTSIGEYAFSGCTNLVSVTIPDSVITIGNYSFYNCNIKEIIIADDSKEVTNTMIVSTQIEKVIIPNGVTTIGEDAFWGCSNLKNVTIPDSVTTIGDSAFCSCSDLKNVTIPESVTTIGNYAFGYGYGYKKIENFTIYGYEGTEAENYANSNGITFVNLSDVPTPKLGDVNGDGEVNIIDVTEIQKYIVGISTFTDEQLKYADAYGDGFVNINDVTEIQKYIVGIVTSLG